MVSAATASEVNCRTIYSRQQSIEAKSRSYTWSKWCLVGARRCIRIAVWKNDTSPPTLCIHTLRYSQQQSNDITQCHKPLYRGNRPWEVEEVTLSKSGNGLSGFDVPRTCLSTGKGIWSLQKNWLSSTQQGL